MGLERKIVVVNTVGSDLVWIGLAENLSALDIDSAYIRLRPCFQIPNKDAAKTSRDGKPDDSDNLIIQRLLNLEKTEAPPEVLLNYKHIISIYQFNLNPS